MSKDINVKYVALVKNYLEAISNNEDNNKEQEINNLVQELKYTPPYIETTTFSPISPNTANSYLTSYEEDLKFLNDILGEDQSSQ